MNEPSRRRIDQIRDPQFVAELESLDVDELRRRRVLCDDLDDELSYYRRMLHGRMDLLGFEKRRRAGEEERSLLEALPEILAAGGGGGHGLADRQLNVDAPEFDGPGRRPIDRILADDFLVRLPELGDDEMRSLQEQLAEVEADISAQRRDVHAAHDRVTAELSRRYREGAADPGDLLTGD